MSDPKRTIERALLGSLLRYPPAIDEAVLLVPSDEAFGDAALRAIYRAILTLHGAGRRVDLVSVAEQLRADGQYDERTPGILAAIWDEVPTGAKAGDYARLLRGQALLWELGFAAEAVAQIAATPTADADAAVAEAERRVLAVAERFTTGEVATLCTTANESAARIDARCDRVGPSPGAVPTGFADLDALIGALNPSELVVVGARPGIGKSALALALARHSARCEVPVHLASLEMGKLELAERLLVSESGVDGQRVRRGLLGRSERAALADALDALRRANVHIDDTPAQSALRVGAVARRLKRQHGVGLVVVDYLQLLEPEDRRVARHEQVGQMSRRLKCLARELCVPVVALAQVNRGSEDRPQQRPRLSDLRESGSIEADADTVLLLHRPPDADGQPDERLIEIDVAKQRNGPTGVVTLLYQRATGRFADYAMDYT